MNDYGAGWPLWDEEGGTGPRDWVLSPALEERLLAWAANFDAHFVHEHGFPTEEMAVKHRAEGEALLPWLRRELGEGYEVVADFWEA
ncbi:hypothetical protein [Brachybacterium aquaticum]|uniref:Uncharacterized protein n=1 Tax=Brachybacterium aquaticum TaxID=1432564 RepID=A0A841AJJ1_9MICO|nr:hypothetical protein [Brachybacterium aquaticum]MBB5833214.1 hypothetical protein [Brachybacterium aquaticum]